MSPTKTLEAQLQHLRSHLDTQSRSLEAVERLLAELPSLSEFNRAAQIARMHTDLHEIDRAGELLSFLVKQARKALDERASPPE